MSAPSPFICDKQTSASSARRHRLVPLPDIAEVLFDQFVGTAEDRLWNR